MREESFFLSSSRLRMGDSEEMPSSIFSANECVIIDILFLCFSQRRIIDFFEFTHPEGGIAFAGPDSPRKKRFGFAAPRRKKLQEPGSCLQAQGFAE